MEQKTDRLYPSAPLENKNFHLEQRSERDLNDVNSFNNSINNIKRMITYLTEKNYISKNKSKNIKR